MNFSSITNSSDVVDYSGDIVGPLEFNCSQYEFGKEPPNVTQHFDGIIESRKIHLQSIQVAIIILQMDFIFISSAGSRRSWICLWRDGQFGPAHTYLSDPNLF